MESEVVIAGISGRFPESDSMEEFWNNLINGIDMVTENNRRWTPGLWGLPRREGKLKHLDKFDATFFGVHAKQANCMDPQQRILLEVAYEAIYDAGIDPFSLAGTKTGVWVGVSSVDASKPYMTNTNTIESYTMTGFMINYLPNRISYFYDLKGPSMVVDTACSSAIVALQAAFESVKSGKCDGAIVAGTNLVLSPQGSVPGFKMGTLSKEGKSKSFDASARGYVRGEAISAVYICKKALSKREYCTIVNVVTNNDGYKPEGIAFPSGKMQNNLIRSAYSSCNVDPNDVIYVEAHATGTKVGDPQEVNSFCDIFTNNRKSPLLIGSVKSNMGHAEASSGLASLAKCVLAMEKGMLPPNLHFSNPNPEITGLTDGRLQVVSVPTPLPKGYIALNSFGIGGSNAHVILKPNEKKEQEAIKDITPQILCFQGRTEKGIREKCTKLLNENLSNASIDLINKSSCVVRTSLPYRGCIVTNVKDPSVQSSLFNKPTSTKRPVWIVFSGMGGNWNGMGRDLLNNNIFQKSISQCTSALKEYDIDIEQLLRNSDDETYDDLVKAFVCLVSIQIGIINILASIGVRADGIVGHSVGELACGYLDGCLSLEQTVQAAYFRGKCITDHKTSEGAMAAVGLTWKDCQSQCPSDITPACHNALNSVTVSGPKHSVEEFVSALKAKEIFARIVNTAGTAFHSPMMKAAVPSYTESLKKVIPQPKRRSSKWKSSSVPQNKWDSELGSYCSAEYIANNMENTVLFHDAVQYVPDNAIVVEVAPHATLEPILKRSLATCTILPLTKQRADSEVAVLYSGIGKLYTLGVDMNLERIIPQIVYPAPAGTLMLCNLVDWDHSQTWSVPTEEMFTNLKGASPIYEIDIKKGAPFHFLFGHAVNGRIVFPATGFLVLAWKAMAELRKVEYDEMPVVLENIAFHKPVMITEQESTHLEVHIIVASHDFFVTRGGDLFASGKVYSSEDCRNKITVSSTPEKPTQNVKMLMKKNEVYKILHLKGYQYRDFFQGIYEMTQDGKHGSVHWKGNWTAFLDSLLQIGSVFSANPDMLLPMRIEKIIIQPQSLKSMHKDSNSLVPIHFDRVLNKIIASEVVEISNVQVVSLPICPLSAIIEKYEFVPFIHMSNDKVCFKRLLDVATENRAELRFYKVLDLQSTEDSSDVELIGKIFSHLDIISIIKLSYVMLETNDATKECLPKHIEFSSWDPEYSPPSELENVDLIVLNGVLEKGDKKFMDQVRPALNKQSGFYFLRETSKFLQKNGFLMTNDQEILSSFDLLLIGIEMSTKDSVVWILCKDIASQSDDLDYEIVEMVENEYDWVKDLKSKLLNDNSRSKVWLIAKDECSGVVGLVNCLRFEPQRERIRCIFNSSIKNGEMDDFKKIIQKDLVINVYQNGTWGSFRHIAIDIPAKVQTSKAYLDTLVKADPSTLCWIADGNHSHTCKVAFAALNTRDILLSSGQLSAHLIPGNKKTCKSPLGMEFSGWDDNGCRIFGLSQGNSLASHVTPDTKCIWKIPEKWTLEEACTIPIAFATAYYALIVRGNLRPKESILIVGGCSDIGQASISVALAKKCLVFVTVSNEKQRWHLIERYALPSDSCFLTSTFNKDDILRLTDGKGVRVMMKCSVEAKVKNLIGFLANHGRFIEVGHYDQSSKQNIGSDLYIQNLSYHSVNVDNLFDDERDERLVYNLISDGIENGTVHPIDRIVFHRDQIADASDHVRSEFMQKTIITVHDNFNQISKLSASCRSECRQDGVYLITGGLGGMGLELCDWLVNKGARKCVITSRSGVTNAYQEMRISKWKQAGADITVSKSDVRSIVETEELLRLCNGIAPVIGIFHLAVVVQNGPFEKQTEETFSVVRDIKYTALVNLDTLSRKLCPKLEWFVVFSSSISGRGNSGTSNYGYANSCAERICEKRFSEGLPGLAIQWAAIADVGIAADSFDGKNVGGTVPQKINSCFTVFDGFLSQKSTAVVSSHIPAPKKLRNKSIKMTLANRIANVLGMQDFSSISQDLTLTNLGLDSLMVVEVQQTLERMCGIKIQIQEIPLLTIAQIKDFEKNCLLMETEIFYRVAV